MPVQKGEYTYYRKTVSLADGTRKDVYGRTKQELEDKIFELQLLTKQGVTPTDMTFGQFAREWYKLYKDDTDLRANSKASIKNTLNTHILPYIGDLPLDTIKPMHIQNVMNKANKCSNSTSTKVLGVMHSIFGVAVENNLIAKTPVSTMLKAGGKTTPKKIALSVDECDRILTNVTNPRAHIFSLIGLNTGMRRGEIVALIWDNIDFENHVIHVRHNAIMSDSKTEIVNYLKTDAGFRDIGMPAELEAALLDWRKKSRNKFVVAMKNGKPLTKSSYRSMWRIVARTLPNKHITAHTMRHTYITRLVEAGIPMDLVQYLAGHKDDRMTKKVYLHLDEEKRAKSAVQAARLVNHNGE